MAGSININPVIVRKELSVLNEAGFVISRKGKKGGFKLSKPSSEITLAEIYLTVKNADVLGKRNQNPNPKCPIGKDINKQLDHLFMEIDHSVEDKLKGKTLKNFVEQFH